MIAMPGRTSLPLILAIVSFFGCGLATVAREHPRCGWLKATNLLGRGGLIAPERAPVQGFCLSAGTGASVLPGAGAGAAGGAWPASVGAGRVVCPSAAGSTAGLGVALASGTSDGQKRARSSA